MKMSNTESDSGSESSVVVMAERELRPRSRPKPRSFVSHAGPSTISAVGASFALATDPLSPPRQDSPTPTVLDDHFEVEETTTSFSVSLHLNDVSATTGGVEPSIVVTPQTPLTREEKASREFIQFVLEGHFDPFDQTYAL